MCNIDNIVAEIVELNTIKSAYNHYLASFEAQVEVENATLVQSNRRIICENLQKLHLQLDEAKKAKANSIKKGDYNTWSSSEPQTVKMKFKTHMVNQIEERAIIHFNGDKRFTITE